MWFQRKSDVVENETKILSLLMRYWELAVRDVKTLPLSVEDIDQQFSDVPKRQALRRQIQGELAVYDRANLRALELRCFFHACQMGELDFDMAAAVESFKELKRRDGTRYKAAADYYRTRYLDLYTVEDFEDGPGTVWTDMNHYYERFFQAVER